MAQKEAQLKWESVYCSICLDLPKDPVSIPCGHNYCMGCIKNHWDTEDEKKFYRCPDCRHSFKARPLLRKNTMLTVLMEELKKIGLETTPADHCYARPEDVACDVCAGRKLKAFKSCLVCLASYCEKHLQPHYDSATFKKHKLVEPSVKLQENICSCHDEVMKMFCRTDQQCICYLCSLDQHKGHDTVLAAKERKEREKEVALSLEKTEQMLWDREEDERKLEREVESVSCSADKAVDSVKVFTELICLLEKISSELVQQIRSRQKSEVSRVKDMQEKLQQEITELRGKHAELKQLSHTPDHNQFLLSHSSLSAFSPSTQSYSVDACALRYFEEVAAAVSRVRGQIQDVLTETCRNISPTVTPFDLLSSPSEPKTRAEFLEYSKEITMDPDTVNEELLLAEGNRKVIYMSEALSYAPHPDRFTYWCQALSVESLTGRCYWEVEWTKEEELQVSIALAYKDIHRAGNSDMCRLGCNENSWTLDCADTCKFYHNDIGTPVSGPVCSRVGVYLDHSAGTLSFYSVSDTMTLLHKVQTTFTQPLYAGVELNNPGDTAEFCKLTKT